MYVCTCKRVSRPLLTHWNTASLVTTIALPTVCRHHSLPSCCSNLPHSPPPPFHLPLMNEKGPKSILSSPYHSLQRDRCRGAGICTHLLHFFLSLPSLSQCHRDMHDTKQKETSLVAHRSRGGRLIVIHGKVSADPLPPLTASLSQVSEHELSSPTFPVEEKRREKEASPIPTHVHYINKGDI